MSNVPSSSFLSIMILDLDGLNTLKKAKEQASMQVLHPVQSCGLTPTYGVI